MDEARYGSAYFWDAVGPSTRQAVRYTGVCAIRPPLTSWTSRAYLVWRFLPHRAHHRYRSSARLYSRSLPRIGCRTRLASSTADAVRDASPGALSTSGDVLEGLPLRVTITDVATCLETLEHLPPDAIPAFPVKLRRVCRGYLFATTPSIGPEPNGPDGFLKGKIVTMYRPRRLLHKGARVRSPSRMTTCTGMSKEPGRGTSYGRVICMVDRGTKENRFYPLRRHQASRFVVMAWRHCGTSTSPGSRR